MLQYLDFMKIWTLSVRTYSPWTNIKVESEHNPQHGGLPQYLELIM